MHKYGRGSRGVVTEKHVSWRQAYKPKETHTRHCHNVHDGALDFSAVISDLTEIMTFSSGNCTWQSWHPLITGDAGYFLTVATQNYQVQQFQRFGNFTNLLPFRELPREINITVISVQEI